MSKQEAKPHLNIIIMGHVDNGKSTTTGHLLYLAGVIDQRTIDAYKAEAEQMGKATFHFAWVLDNLKEERERGVTIKATTKEFFTASKHYTIIDAPGHSTFIKNMITGSSQADVALILVPADGNFTTSIAKGNIKALEKNYANLFDFRNSSIKRKDFNAHKREWFQILCGRAHGICQICKSAKGTEIDHFIPIASNILNKKFRNMRPVKFDGRLHKVPSESYGSNHLDNLRLACKPCNRKKWHRF